MLWKTSLWYKVGVHISQAPVRHGDRIFLFAVVPKHWWILSWNVFHVTPPGASSFEVTAAFSGSWCIPGIGPAQSS